MESWSNDKIRPQVIKEYFSPHVLRLEGIGR
jgi:hypothetical protein